MRPFFFILLALLCVFFACKNDTPPAAAPNAPGGAMPDPIVAKITAALEKDPNNDSLYFRRAEALYYAEGYDEALLDLSKAMQLDSMQPAYYHLMADVLMDYARPNDSRRAIDALKTALRKFPNRISTLLKLSEIQLIVRQHSDALGNIHQILEQDPDNADAFYLTGRVALDMKDTIRAIASLQKSMEINADNVEGWVFLGRIFSNKNNPLAVRFFDNALRLDSTNLEVREYKAAYYKRRGEFDKAFATYKDIIARDPQYANAWFDMGMIYLEQEQFDKALEHFNIAIKTDPIFINAYYYRGYAAELKGDHAKAKEDYLQVQKMAPSYPEIKEALARVAK